MGRAAQDFVTHLVAKSVGYGQSNDQGAHANRNPCNCYDHCHTRE
jgi:hypothetical protein